MYLCMNFAIISLCLHFLFGKNKYAILYFVVFIYQEETHILCAICFNCLGISLELDNTTAFMSN